MADFSEAFFGEVDAGKPCAVGERKKSDFRDTLGNLDAGHGQASAESTVADFRDPLGYGYVSCRVWPCN